MQQIAPTHWMFLDMTAQTKEQCKRNKQENPRTVCMCVLERMRYLSVIDTVTAVESVHHKII